MVCLNHPDREAVFRCAACAKPICEECAIHFNGSVYCSELCRERGEAGKSRSELIIDEKLRTGRKSIAKGIVFFIIILILAAAGAYFYMQNKDKVDSTVSDKVKTVKKEVESTKDAFIEAGQKKAPTDSQYRRDRESMVKDK